MQRFYCEDIDRPTVEILGSEAKHIASVMRLKHGDKVELFDGAGGLAAATIQQAGNKSVILHIDNFSRVDAETNHRIIIAVSIAKGDRFDWMLQKCTELGVSRIVPVVFERTVKQPKNPKAFQRWQTIAITACKQCKRLFLPEIDMPMKLSQAIEKLKCEYPDAMFLTGSLAESAKPISKIDVAGRDTVCFVGPEGGLTEDEETLLKENDALQVKLTDTVLRTETAAEAFAAILSVGNFC